MCRLKPKLKEFPALYIAACHNGTEGSWFFKICNAILLFCANPPTSRQSTAVPLSEKDEFMIKRFENEMMS